jgi:DNA-binding transcriptional MerR regulator
VSGPCDTGMPIARMRRYAELDREGEPTLAERLRLLTEHDGQVSERVAVLQAQRLHLQEKIDWYCSQLSAHFRVRARLVQRAVQARSR